MKLHPISYAGASENSGATANVRASVSGGLSNALDGSQQIGLGAGNYRYSTYGTKQIAEYAP